MEMKKTIKELFEECCAKLGNDKAVEMFDFLKLGYRAGYRDGYSDACEEIQIDYEAGYDDGHEAGYNLGSDDGYDEGYGQFGGSVLVFLLLLVPFIRVTSTRKNRKK